MACIMASRRRKLSAESCPSTASLLITVDSISLHKHTPIRHTTGTITITTIVTIRLWEKTIKQTLNVEKNTDHLRPKGRISKFLSSQCGRLTPKSFHEFGRSSLWIDVIGTYWRAMNGECYLDVWLKLKILEINCNKCKTNVPADY